MVEATPEHVAAVRRLATTANGVRVALEKSLLEMAKLHGGKAGPWLDQVEASVLHEVKSIDATALGEEIEASGTAGALAFVALTFSEVRKALAER